MENVTPFQGLSTEPEVQAIVARLNDIPEGGVIEHAELERMIHATRSSTRYGTIITKLKARVEKEQSITLVSERGVGYIKSTGEQQMHEVIRGVARAARQAHRSWNRAAIITDERLPDQRMRDARDFIVERGRLLMEMARTQRKAMAVVLARPETLPRLTE